MAKHTLSIRPSLALLTGIVAFSSACTLWQREPNYYSEFLTELFETRSEAIDACYDRYLAQVDPTAAGTLAVSFEVEAKTGALKIIEAPSELPDALAACVLDELAGLKVDPPDVNTARGVFEWEFSPASRKQTPEDPFGLAQQTLLSCYSAHLASVDREASGVLVIDYSLERETGALARFEIVAGETTAPAAVVECAKPSFEAAALEPEQVDARNVSGKRSFKLHYTPYDAG